MKVAAAKPGVMTDSVRSSSTADHDPGHKAEEDGGGGARYDTTPSRRRDLEAGSGERVERVAVGASHS